jgi:uncharacterized membrane protein
MCSVWLSEQRVTLVLYIINPLNAELNAIRHLLVLAGAHHFVDVSRIRVNPLNAELNAICHLLVLPGAHHFVDVSRIRVKIPAQETTVSSVRKIDMKLCLS